MTAVPPNDNQQNTEQAKIVGQYCKKPGHIIRDCRKRTRKEQEQRNDPSIQNTKHVTHSHHVHIANEQTILQKNAEVVPTQQIDQNGSNRVVQQTIEMMGKN